MKTRFDVYGKWITACGEVRNVYDMDTDHIMNTMRMLIQKPSRTISMLIKDMEGCVYGSPFEIFPVAWEPDIRSVLKQSIHNVISMTLEQLKDYVKKTPLFQSMCDELGKRGVNVANILSILETCDAF
jgi:hypothetical protein